WLWDFGTATGTSTLQNPSYVYPSSGAFLVTLTVIDNMMNTSTYTDSVWVHSNPVAGFTSTANCAGMYMFNDTSSVTNGSINEWMWNFGDPMSGVNDTSTMENPSHTYSAGTYTVTQIVSSTFGCTDTATNSITFNPLTASLSNAVSQNSVVFTGSATGGTGSHSFMLDFGDLSIPSANPNATHFYTDGTYTACLTAIDANGCIDSSCTTFTINTGVGISNYNNVTSVSIAPNPTEDGIVNITIANSSNSVISIHNILGKVIMNKVVNDNVNIMDLSAEANGAYFITVRTSKEVITKKVIISK
ncbi:MAG TPA: PKD domain-containing protein, partial [Pedobacter sp.]